MTLIIEVTKVIIVTGRGPDLVSFCTTEVSPTPGLTEEPLSLDFKVAAGDGRRYVIEVLGIDAECVEVIHA